MASKFINTERTDIINSLAEGYKKRLDNPYYVHMESPSPVTYYNQNTTKSTLEDGSRLTYDIYTDLSSLRYNKINNFYIYGLSKIVAQLENEDWGVYSGEISGEGTILPNSIVPIPGDYFTIPLMGKSALFRITESTYDTFDNGANLYKISYHIENTDIGAVDELVVGEFDFIADNVGTNLKVVIRSNEYKLTEQMDEVLCRLKEYYKRLFYNNRVQTFTFIHRGNYFYDPYMIEFIKSHNLMSGISEFLFVDHVTTVGADFVLNYDKTFFRSLEMRSIDKDPIITSQGVYIDETLSILYSRKEDYFKIQYGDTGIRVLPTIYNFEYTLIDHIKTRTAFEEEDTEYLNIIVKYMNNIAIDGDDLATLENIDYDSNIRLFYDLPAIIYCLQQEIVGMISKKH